MVSALVMQETPFSKSAGPATFTLEQYASLCAEEQQAPEQADAIAKRYQLPTAAARKSIEDRWSSALESDAELRERFTDLVKHYRRWLQSKPGGSR